MTYADYEQAKMWAIFCVAVMTFFIVWVLYNMEKKDLYRRFKIKDKKEFRTTLKKNVKRAFDIFFADAKNTFDRIISIFSAFFWIWLEWSFMIFFFTYAFGFIGYLNGGYPESLRLIQENRAFWDKIALVFVLLITVLRIPLYNKKEVKSKK